MKQREGKRNLQPGAKEPFVSLPGIKITEQRWKKGFFRLWFFSLTCHPVDSATRKGKKNKAKLSSDKYSAAVTNRNIKVKEKGIDLWFSQEVLRNQ